MNVLALDASTDTSYVALRCGSNAWFEECNEQRSHAAFILPAINRLLEQAHLSAAQLDGILVGKGPGSFTGTRIAISITQGLGYGIQAKVYGIESMRIFSYALQKLLIKEYRLREFPVSHIFCAFDARMEEIYFSASECSVSDSPADSLVANRLELIPKKELAKKAELMLISKKEFFFTGDAWSETLAQLPKTKLRYVPIGKLSVGEAMLELATHGFENHVDIKQLEPIYLRSGISWQKRRRIRH